MVLVTPTPMPADPPENKEPSKFRKDMGTIGSRMLTGVNRGLFSGALQFAKLGAVCGAIFALPFLFSLGWLPALGWVAAGAVQGATVGAVGVGVINLVGGLFDGLRDNFHRGRNERAAKRVMEREQSAAPEPTLLQKLGLSGAKNAPESSDISAIYTMPKPNKPVGSTVSAPRPGNRSTEIPSASASVSSSAESPPAPPENFGQGPGSGGSWDELVRRNSGPQTHAR